MTDEEKNLNDVNNKPFELPEQPASPSEPPQAAWEPEPYTPPTAEPPAGMADTTPDEHLFAAPNINASSFEAAPQVQAEGNFPPPPPSSTASGTPPKQGGMKWWVIVLIVVVVLCCCCLVIGGLLYVFGDQLMQQLESYSWLATTLAM
jgi:hypothetical protein